jgi:hypothetical protein
MRVHEKPNPVSGQMVLIISKPDYIVWLGEAGTAAPSFAHQVMDKSLILFRHCLEEQHATLLLAHSFGHALQGREVLIMGPWPT